MILHVYYLMNFNPALPTIQFYWTPALSWILLPFLVYQLVRYVLALIP